ncbi:MAG: aminotransferase class V-fold PLP-dependent enzyme [Bryobacteraceae bacterium]
MNSKHDRANTTDIDWVLSLFDLDSVEGRAFDQQLSKLANQFLQSEHFTSPGSSALVRDKLLDTRMPEDPLSPGAYLDYIEADIVSEAMNVASPRFVGRMTSALPSFVRHVGHLMLAMNQNTVKLETSKSLTYLERQVLAIIHRFVYRFEPSFYAEHVQNSASTLGMITSGGTVANITALWCARNQALGPQRDFAGVEAEGIPAALAHYGYAGAVVIGSSLMHYSLEKAVGVLGLGTRSLRRVPVNHQNQVDLKALKDVLAECKRRKQLVVAIIGVAGTTDSGAIDPLAEMADLANEYGTHFHIDAAWGGAMLFSREHGPKLAGIEGADSVTFDGHKQLYLPIGIGMVLFRDPRMAANIEKQARYIVRPGSFDLGRRSLEGSRPAMVLLLHAALNLIGRRGYEALIDEGIRKAQYLVQTIAGRPEFEVLVQPQMNIVLYRYLPRRYRSNSMLHDLSEDDQVVINEFNQRLQQRQRRAGLTFVSRTTLECTCPGHTVPVVALRAVFANPLTTQRDIEAVLDDQVRLAESLESENQSMAVRLPPRAARVSF